MCGSRAASPPGRVDGVPDHAAAPSSGLELDAFRCHLRRVDGVESARQSVGEQDRHAIVPWGARGKTPGARASTRQQKQRSQDADLVFLSLPYMRREFMC